VTAPQFAALLTLQETDTALDQVRHRRRHLPARAELAAVAKQRAELTVRRETAEARRDEVAGRQAHLEDDLSAAEKRSREVSALLYGGTVSASRELQTLAADIDLLKARASDLEDSILTLLDEREPLDAAVAALDDEESDLDGRAETATAELAVGEASADSEEAELIERRAAAAAAVPADLVTTYERLRPRLSGVGAARLIGSHCDGCHLELPATEIDRIRHLPPDAIEYCDQCGRILVRP
jgi:uncharacterized protein